MALRYLLLFWVRALVVSSLYFHPRINEVLNTIYRDTHIMILKSDVFPNIEILGSIWQILYLKNWRMSFISANNVNIDVTCNFILSQPIVFVL